jgi:hypothetical protein
MINTGKNKRWQEKKQQADDDLHGLNFESDVWANARKKAEKIVASRADDLFVV